MPGSNPLPALRPAIALALTLGLAACGREAPPADAAATRDQVHGSLFANGDFEGGTLAGWTVTANSNNGIIAPPASLADLQLAIGGANRSRVVTGATGMLVPAGLSAAGSTLRVPRYGGAVAVVNELSYSGNGYAQNVNTMSQKMTVTNADIDPADGKVHVRFAIAPVLQNPNHANNEQPYFWIQLYNVTRTTMLFQTFNFSNQAGVPWKTDGTTGTLYTDWKSFDISPGEATLRVGDEVELQVVAASCSLGGHYGHVYVDSFGPVLPGLAVTATAPQSVNTGAALTYTLTYKNAGPGAAEGVVVSQTLPAGTTFVSVNAPPGLTCTAPAVGAAGVVQCTIGALPAASTGSFDVTVQVTAAAGATVSNGNYQISGTGSSPLLGPLVQTAVTSSVAYADLSATVSDGVAAVVWGAPVSYVIRVANAGPVAVTGATITAPLPAQLTGATWTCSGTGGATCTASGSGGLGTQAATLPVGGAVTYLLSASVIAGSGTGSVVHQVSVAPPAAASDPDASDNVAVDVDSIGTLRALTLQKAGAGDGTVVSAPVAISCGAACSSQSASFLDGTTVVLTATAAPGSVLSGWSGACSGTGTSCSVTLSAAATATVTFIPIPRSLTASVPAGNGTVSCPSPVPNGSPATCTIAPDARYHLSALTDNGADVLGAVSGGSYALASVTGDHALVATFAANTSSLALALSPTGAVAGQTVTATATAAGLSPAGTPGGTVTFYADGVAVPGCVDVPLTGGVATCSAGGPAGAHTLTAVASGDATWPGATSSAVGLTIAQASTTTALTDAPVATSVYGQPVILTAAVAVVAPGGGTPAGTVTFRDGATTLGSATLGAGGTATYSTSTLAPGAHSLTAVYAGNASYTGSTSPAVNHSVTAAATAVAVSAAPSPAFVGQPVTVHVAVTALAPSGAVPQGTVEILDGATVVGTAVLRADGTVDFTTSTLAPGPHLFTARLLASGPFAGATSATPAGVLVLQAGTATAVASSLNPSSYGAPVTFTATVTSLPPGGGTPSGDVQFRDGETVLATVALDGAGHAAFTTAALSAGAHVLTARYLGTPAYNASSATLTQAVTQASTSVALAASADPTVVGQPVTFTATVGSTGGTPGGTVTFTAGGQVIGTATVQADGTAVLTTTALPVGATSVVATYQGSADFSASSSSALAHTVQPASTAVALGASPSPSQLGAPVALTATVIALAPGAGIPGGTVTFRDGAAVLGTAALDAGGVATLGGVSQLTLGDHTLSATYEGSPSYLGSSGTAAQSVVQGAAAVAVASSLNPSRYGRPVTFTATVTSPGGTPTGTVTFLSGDDVLGTGQLDGSGAATLTLRDLAKGTHPVTARYPGSDAFEQASGALAGGQVVENSPPVAGAGQALVLGDGQASSATADGAGALDGVRTVELWARAGWSTAGEVTDVPSLIRVGDDTTPRYGLGLSADRAALDVRYGTTAQPVAAALGDGAWHHLALVSGAGGVTAYVDGAVAATLPGGFDDAAGDRVELGKGFLGELDEVRLWSSARTAEELAADARRPVAADAAGLVALWRMDDHLGDTTFDAGPAAIDLTAALRGTPEDADPAFGTSSAWRLRTAESAQPISPVDAGYDVDGDPLALTVTAAPAHGTATVDAEALQVGYQSRAGWAGRDQLTYQLDDGEAQSSAEVEIAVAVPLTCRVDADCLAGDLCVSGFCVDPDALKVRSGTGCSTGGGASLLLGLLALALAFRRRLPTLAASAARRSGPAFLAALALLAGAARAQTPTGFQLQTYEPAPAGDRFFVVPGAEVQGHLRPAAGLVLDWAKDPLVLKHGDTVVSGGRIVKSAFWGHAVGSLALADRVLVDVAVPVALSQDGDKPFSALPKVSSSALGDVRLGARTPLPRLGPVALAAGLDVWLPTGKREAFSSERALRALPKVILGGSAGRAELGASVGFLVRQDKDVTLTRTGSALAFSAGAAWAFDRLRVGPELYGRWQFKGTATSPIEALLGARYALGSFDLGLAAGTAFNDSPGAAPLRLIGQLAWRPQAAAEPAPAPAPAPEPAVEAPPAPPPAPADRDQDGVVDADDACPDEAGLRDADPARNGCPALPPPPPPPPPADRDQDGVVDADDACPDQAGQASDDPARNGCPALAVVSGGRIELLQQIQFEHDRDVIRQDSLPILEEVARVLGAHPEIAKVAVEGHTDSRGSVAHNTSLSDRRAKAVRRWLVAKGIDPARLTAKGYGPSRPVADNATAEGRAANRRVEFHLQ